MQSLEGRALIKRDLRITRTWSDAGVKVNKGIAMHAAYPSPLLLKNQLFTICTIVRYIIKIIKEKQNTVLKHIRSPVRS
jgi:hypothetical protein